MTGSLLIPRRVERCQAALDRYSDDNPCVGLIDLLADARHWCDQHGENFAELDRIAHVHYLAELNPDEGGNNP